jgi:predicted O-methyltransferase YrrM
MSTAIEATIRPATRRRPAIRGAFRPLLSGLASAVPGVPSGAFRRALVERLYDRDREMVTDTLGRRSYASMTLDGIELDFPPAGRVQFEDLAGLFPSTPLAFGVALMTPRQLAYVFGLARRAGARTAIEIGRYKGGATVALAAAIAPHGTLWSIDDGSLELDPTEARFTRPHDEQIGDMCRHLGLDARLLVGDSRTIEVNTGPADVVLIDGDHRYKGVKADIERWGKRARIGGHVLLDDVFPLGAYRRGCDEVARAVQESIDDGGFKLVRAVDRMAHLERIR